VWLPDAMFLRERKLVMLAFMRSMMYPPWRNRAASRSRLRRSTRSTARPGGHDLIGFLATHPEVLQQVGFATSVSSPGSPRAQDPKNCPPDLEKPTIRESSHHRCCCEETCVG
jgi:hypothetical protein